MSARAQTFTLEAFVAAILLVATVGFALQAVTISANTGGAVDAELREQQSGLAAGVLDRTVENGDLRSTLVYWNESEGRFHGADEDEGFYVARAPPTAFGSALSGVLDGARLRYNVELHYRGANGTHETRRLAEMGTPTADATRVTETVTLYDDTRLVDANETVRENATLSSVEEGFYAPDAAANGRLYNVVRVEVVLWRT